MTFLEAAEAVLKESGAPLHYKEITARAQQKGLIQSSGKTPEATMGALLYTAVAKAKEQGVAGTFRPAGKAHFGLALSAVGGAVQSAIEAQNKKAAKELLDFLHGMHPRQLELIVGRLLEQIGFEDVKVTDYVGDGGIDVNATLTVGGVTKVKTAIQVKRFKERANVGVKVVRELRGSLVTDQRGLIITTSKFAEGAKEEAEAQSKTPISLIDGEHLVQLLMKHEIGAERELVPLYKVKLDDLLTEEPDGGTGEKSATLWPLPGGQENFFESLLKFLDEIGSQKPTLDQMTDWVLKTFEKVTKQTVVESYLRAVLTPLNLIEFEGDRIVLTSDGEALRTKRERDLLLELLRKNITGIVELLDALSKNALTVEQAWEHLEKTVGVKWDSDNQVKYRLQWLAASGAVRRDGKQWLLTEGA